VIIRPLPGLRLRRRELWPLPGPFQRAFDSQYAALRIKGVVGGSRRLADPRSGAKEDRIQRVLRWRCGCSRVLKVGTNLRRGPNGRFALADRRSGDGIGMTQSPDWAAFGRKGGKARLKKMTRAQRQAVARLGVQAFLEKTTAKQRSETAKKAAAARWTKHRAVTKKKPSR
jgi:hypothetical protein